MRFNAGDKVKVVNELNLWVMLGEGERLEADQYTVIKSYPAFRPCCVGHEQSLIVTNDRTGKESHASAAWFDPDLIGKPRKMCSGDHYAETPDEPSTHIEHHLTQYRAEDLQARRELRNCHRQPGDPRD